MRPGALGLACVALWLAFGAAAPAAAQPCVPASAYPGDSASREAIATWMAYGAVARGVPGELPVMAALVESGLRNLSYGDSDMVGYFQMRTAIWNRGEYAGYPENPDLQLKWFLDYAVLTRQQRLALDGVDYAGSDARYGDWAADVMRPAEQFRGRYQPRLAEARGLIGPLCLDTPPGGVPPGGVPPGGSPTPPGPADVVAPFLAVPASGVKASSRAIGVVVSCPQEACVVTLGAQLVVPAAHARAAAARTFHLTSKPRSLTGGGRATLRLRFGHRVRRAVAASLRAGRPVRANLRVRALDAAGNASSTRRRAVLRARH